jgi:hypothetical protein
MVRCEPPVGRRGGLTNDSGTDYPVQYQKAALAKCHPQDPQDPQTKNPQKRPIYQYNQFVTPKSGVIHWAAAQRHLNGFIREQRANARARAGYLTTTFSEDTIPDGHKHRGRRIVLYDGEGDLDRDFEWWDLETDRLSILPQLPFVKERTDVLTCQSKTDIENINLMATLLSHHQARGYWEHLGRRFVADVEALLERHSRLYPTFPHELWNGVDDAYSIKKLTAIHRRCLPVDPDSKLVMATAAAKIISDLSVSCNARRKVCES